MRTIIKKKHLSTNLSPTLNPKQSHNCFLQRCMPAWVRTDESHCLSTWLHHPYYHRCLHQNLHHCQNSFRCSHCPTEKKLNINSKLLFFSSLNKFVPKDLRLFVIQPLQCPLLHIPPLQVLPPPPYSRVSFPSHRLIFQGSYHLSLPVPETLTVSIKLQNIRRLKIYLFWDARTQPDLI